MDSVTLIIIAIFAALLLATQCMIVAFLKRQGAEQLKQAISMTEFFEVKSEAVNNRLQELEKGLNSFAKKETITDVKKDIMLDVKRRTEAVVIQATNLIVEEIKGVKNIVKPFTRLFGVSF